MDKEATEHDLEEDLPYFEGRRALVVEDDPTHRAFIAQILKDLGIDSIMAEDGQIALVKIDSGIEIDLIFLDWDMPGMDGLTTAHAICSRRHRSNLENVPIIGFTVHAEPGDKEKCLSAGMDDYMPKNIWRPKWKPQIAAKLERWLSDKPERETGMFVDVPDREVLGSGEEQIDYSMFKEIREQMGDKFPDMVEAYQQKSEAYLWGIKKGLREGDAKLIAANAHPFGSSSDLLGLVAVRNLARGIEHIAKRRMQTGVTPLNFKDELKNLEKAYQHANTFLNGVLEED